VEKLLTFFLISVMLRATTLRRFISLTSAVLNTPPKVVSSSLFLTLKHRSLSTNSKMSATVAEVKPGTTRIGWIGTGVMGTSMVGHIMKAGYSATVFNRTASKAQALVEKGAKVAASPKEVAEQSDIVFTIVGYPKDVEEVILGSNGVLAGLKPGGIVVDMTTSKPSLAQQISQAALAKGCHSVDAPVSGGDIGAREARLSIMVGGEQNVVEAIEPLFKCMGTNIKYMGPAGAGQNTKMVNQILISTMMVGLVEGLIYGYKAGLDLNQVLAAVSAGAAGSWSLNNYTPRIFKRNFDPGFFVEHFIKDLEIAMSEAQQMDLKLPGLELALKLYNELKALGHGKKGTHALMLVLEKMNNVEVVVPQPAEEKK
jgi:3-hydroxyisobutyrate dehydrogenase